MSKCPLIEKLDAAVVALRDFKDALDSLDDDRRDAAFALARPAHPCFETLIDDMSRWNSRLSAAEETNPEGPEQKESAQ